MRLYASTILLPILALGLPSLVLGIPSEGNLLRRQPDASSTAPPTSTVSNESSKTGSSNPTTGKTQTGDSASSSNISVTNTKGGTTTKTATNTGTFIDPRLPPGNVVMQTPATTSGTQYYKIGSPVTFGWNYTSLIITPTAVNVEAYCSQNSQTYTIAQNLSIAKPSVVWDTSLEQANNNEPPLAMAFYTLLIYDEASAVTAVPSAGYLAAFNGFQFGMYTPQPYTPLQDFNCATCDPSMANTLDLTALRMMLITSLITSLSFIWFVTGLY